MGLRPGVDVVLRSTPVPTSAPTNMGVSFVVGLSDTGPANQATPILSISDFERIFGLRQSYSLLYDSLDIFFREGGGLVWISRVVGPAAVTGTATLLDASAAIALTATAIGPGAFSSGISIGVRAGVGAGNFALFIVVGGVEVETSGDLADNNAAVLWSKNSKYVRLTLGASLLDPAVAAAKALSAGNDDRANVTDAEWQKALDGIPTDFGPGQVWSPGRTTDIGHQQLLSHANTHRRVAILDAPDSSSIAALQASVIASRAGSQRFGGMFWPWAVCDGVVAGTTRKVPWSAVQAAMMNRNDASGFGPSDPAAGDNGISFTAIDLSQVAVSDVNRDLLNSSGINVVRMMFGQARTYGYRTLVDPLTDSNWISLGHARLFAILAARGSAIGERYMFDTIDGQGKKIGEFAKDLVAMLQEYYFNGDLYGQTPADAFRVDVGSAVNTPETLANNELHAILAVKMSPFTEYVKIEIVKKPITEGMV